jgi:hypothetical protein
MILAKMRCRLDAKNPFLLKLFATLRFYTLGWLLLDALTPSYRFFLAKGRGEMAIDYGCSAISLIYTGVPLSGKKSIRSVGSYWMH